MLATMPARNARLRRASAGLALALLAALATPALAQSPDPNESQTRAREAIWVIPPGREADAAALLASVKAATPAELTWFGPQIEIDRVKWWLNAGDETRAILVLVPAELGSDEAPRSESFAIEVLWAPDVEPSAAERALMADAVAAIQANDSGGFYSVAVDNALEIGGVVLDLRSSSSTATLDPAEARRRWTLRVAGVSLLGLLALAVAIRGLYAAPGGGPETGGGRLT